MSATLTLTRRYLTEYARRPINLVLLVVVPLIFVTLAAGAIADFAEVVGGLGDQDQLAAPTAGWAAGFIAGVAGLFHVLGSRRADRRLTLAGMGAARITVARLLSGVVLAVLAAVSAIGALALRTGMVDPVRTSIGTLMFGLLYLGLGVGIGAFVRNDVNGSLGVIFIWMLDVFLGPAMAGSDVWITRVFPSHYLTLLVLDAESGHSGPIGDLGWALVWTLGSIAIAALVFATATGRIGDLRTRSRSGWSRVRAGFRFGFRDYRRNVAMWVLLVFLPVFFITLSFWITPDEPTPVELTNDGVQQIEIVSMIDVHGAIMVPITIAFLAGLAGLFVVQGSMQADARLALAGFKTREILTARFGVIAIAALLTTGVSLAVTSVDFAAERWIGFMGGNILVALIYGMLGVLVGAVFGRLGGLYVMFLLPFIDVGLAQNVMFSASPPDWGLFLPARGAVKILTDAAFTTTFDQTSSLVLTAAWLVGIGVTTAVVFGRIARPKSV